jgi:hypothetical protein
VEKSSKGNESPSRTVKTKEEEEEDILVCDHCR